MRAGPRSRKEQEEAERCCQCYRSTPFRMDFERIGLLTEQQKNMEAKEFGSSFINF